MKCTELRACSLSARGLWIDLLCFMWESTERGYLTLNGRPIPEENIARMVGTTQDMVHILLSELELFAVFSRRPDGAIFSRKMIKDEKLRILRKEIGGKGGNPMLLVNHIDNQKVNQKVNQNTENETENEVEVESSKKTTKRIKKPIHPTLEEVKAYCLERKSPIDPETFFHHYEGADWIKANNKPVVNWKSTLIIWEKKEKPKNIASGTLRKEEPAVWVKPDPKQQEEVAKLTRETLSTMGVK